MPNLFTRLRREIDVLDLMSKIKLSCAVSLMILIWSLIHFVLQSSAALCSLTNLHLSRNFLARLLIMTEKRRGLRRVPWLLQYEQGIMIHIFKCLSSI
jgi:hypothetical protein